MKLAEFEGHKGWYDESAQEFYPQAQWQDAEYEGKRGIFNAQTNEFLPLKDYSSSSGYSPVDTMKENFSKAGKQTLRYLDLFAGGANKTLANLLGMPVDAINSALGAMGAPVSDQPFGGSQSIKAGQEAISGGEIKPEGVVENIVHAAGEQAPNVLLPVGVAARTGQATAAIKAAVPFAGGAATASGMFRGVAPERSTVTGLEGAAYDATDLALQILGGFTPSGVRKVVNALQEAKKAGGIKEVTIKGINRLAEKQAAKKVESTKTKEPKTVVDQIMANEEEAAQLEKDIRGLRFNVGQKGGDPNLLSLARQTGQSPGAGSALYAESTMGQNQALGDYIAQYLKGEGNIDDLLMAIQKEQRAVRGKATAAGQAAEGEAAKIGGRSAQDVGGQMYEKAQAGRAASARYAEKLYSEVPEDLKIEGNPLFDKINELFGDYDKFTQRLSATPTEAAKRVKEAFGPLVTQKAAEAPSIAKAAVERAKTGGGFIIKIGNKTLDDQTGVPQWFRTEEQANRVAQGVNDRTMQAAQAKQATVTAQGPSRAVTMKQMKDFRSQMSTLQRDAAASGDHELAYKAGLLKDGVNETLSLAAEQGQGEAVDALRAATSYWRDIHVPTFRRGATGKILKPDKTGGQRVVDSAIGGEYFKSGKGAVEAADDFMRTFGKDPQSKGLIEDYAAQSLLKAARNPMTGELDSKRVAQWIYQHKDAIDRFGIRGKFSSLEKALKFADDARDAEYAFNKSALAKALNVDPDRAIAEVLMTGTGRKQSIARLQELVSIAKRSDPTGAAIDGLKAGIADYFQRSTLTTARDLKGNVFESFAKIDKFMREYRPAFEQSGLYSKSELQAFDNVHRALGKIAAQARPNAAFTGSPTFELFQRLGGVAASVAVKRGSVYGVGKTLLSMFSKPFANMVDEAVAKAVFDPRYAEAISRLAINYKRVGPEKAAQIFTRRLAMFGQIATKEGGDSK